MTPVMVTKIYPSLCQQGQCFAGYYYMIYGHILYVDYDTGHGDKDISEPVSTTNQSLADIFPPFPQ